MELTTNATRPSHREAITPPPACGPWAARLLNAVLLGGVSPVTYPCDGWCTQMNSLEPSPAPIQLRLAVWSNSMNRNVLLVPSVISVRRTLLLRKPTPYWLVCVRSGQQVLFRPPLMP